MAMRLLPVTMLIVALILVLESAVREVCSPLVALAEEEKRGKALDKKLQAHMLRLEAQRQIFDQLLQADMTLREAAAQIRAGIDQKELELLIKMAELEDESGSVEELLCRHVVRMMRHHVYPGRPGTEALLARTRAILTSSR